MSELKEEHFEVIDKNKAKIHQDQKAMREVYKLTKTLKERKNAG
jgi:hypothetical protein